MPPIRDLYIFLFHVLSKSSTVTAPLGYCNEKFNVPMENCSFLLKYELMYVNRGGVRALI